MAIYISESGPIFLAILLMAGSDVSEIPTPNVHCLYKISDTRIIQASTYIYTQWAYLLGARVILEQLLDQITDVGLGKRNNYIFNGSSNILHVNEYLWERIE